MNEREVVKILTEVAVTRAEAEIVSNNEQLILISLDLHIKAISGINFEFD
jgi:hypothetical protein